MPGSNQERPLLMKVFAKKFLFFALTAALWSVFLWFSFFARTDEPMFDFIPVFAAARAVDNPGTAKHMYDRDPDHFNIVTDGPLFEIARSSGFRMIPTPFVYPPLYAWIMKPLAQLEYPTARTVLTFVNACAFVLGIFLVSLSVLDAFPLRWILLSVPLLCAGFSPIAYSSSLGQITPLIFCAVCLSLHLIQRGREIPAGILLGAVFAVKLFPLGIMIMMIPYRRFRALTAALATWAAFLLLSAAFSGVTVTGRYLETIFSIASSGSVAAWNNQTVTGMLLRMVSDSSAAFHWGYINPGWWITLSDGIITIIFLAWSVLIPCRYFNLRESSGRLPVTADSNTLNALMFSQGILLSFILAPISWSHYHILAIVPACMAVILIMHEHSLNKHRLLIFPAIAWILLSIDPAAIAHSLLQPRPGISTGGIASLAVSTGLMGVFILFVTLNLLATSAGGDKTRV